jgi:branched-chain amino acid transport system substrate-binding protein
MLRAFRRLVPFFMVGAALLLAACGGGGGGGEGTATKPPITLGLMYDGTGATQLVGVPLKAGLEDYIRLVNKRGGVDGHPINAIFIDNAYEVPKGVDAYERMKREGAVAILTYGTPINAALLERCNADQIPCLSPGFGAASGANGQKYPYSFPMAASYWSQAAGAVQFILDQWERAGQSGRPKIAYLYYDNPAGREPLEVLRSLAQREGFELREFAVPAPGLEMATQVQDIAQRYRADWVITHLFGRAPSVSIKTFKENNYPLDRVVSFVWGSADADILAAGGWDIAQGYYGLQFTAIGADLPALNDIRRMYQEEGQQPSEFLQRGDVYYSRGVAIAAALVEAARVALDRHGYPLDGPKMKEALESLRGDIAGIMTLRMSPQDHEGGGFVRIYQVKGSGWEPVTEWYNAYRDVINQFLQR